MDADGVRLQKGEVSIEGVPGWYAHGFISQINLAEVYYKSILAVGIERARQFLDNFERLPLTILVPDRNLIWKAAEIKAEFSISYADCFALATAMGLGAKVVTGDPDFKKTIQLVAVGMGLNACSLWYKRCA